MKVEGKKHIVIIGAGFAGLKLARTLNNHEDYHLTLIDKNNFHQFQPLLYQVAMANLDASNVSFPLRNIFKKSKNVSIRIGTVSHVDQEKNVVETTCGNFTFDYLVVATGAISNYFGNASIEANCLPMKSTWEALQIRNMLLLHFEESVSSRQRISACCFADLRTNGFLIDLRTEESRPGDRRDADEGLDQVGLGLLRVAVRVAHGGPFPRPIAH